MTRINTNVSSLVAQNTLVRSHAALDQSLTRLSTGLRINTGKDDPAGLIASENLRSDITSIQRAIGNTDRANQVISTADSALGQVSSLLNDIRGLVTESANTGALSKDQIAADQLQIDSSLKALNRIAQTTTFQGRRLLDGSLDFITTAGSGFGTVSDLKIDTANLGSTGSVAVGVNVTAAATTAQVTNTAIPAATAAVHSSADVTFTDAATASAGTVNIALVAKQTTGTLTFGTTSSQALVITAKAGGNAAGAVGGAFGGLDVVFVDDSATVGGVNSATYNAGSNQITVHADFSSGSLTSTEVQTAIAAIGSSNDFTVTGGTSTNLAAGDATTYTNVATGGRDASTEAITLTGIVGAGGNATFSFTEANLSGSGTNVIANGGGSYTIQLDNSIAGGVNISAIATAIQSTAEIATATYGGSAKYIASIDSAPVGAQAATGGKNLSSDVITVTADAAGTAANTKTVTIVEATGVGTTPQAVVSGGNITVTVDDSATTTISDIKDAINGLSGYSATISSSAGDGDYVGSSDAPPSVATLAGGVTGAGGLDSDIVFELSGATGADVLSFGTGTGISTIVDAINAGSDSTGVTAVDNAGTLELTSTAYGSDAFVNVNILSGDSSHTFATGLSATRATGTDITASVNGIQASGRGNTLSINTASLDLSLTVSAGSSTSVNFTIDGGGALFQLGPEVVSNQQARVGITSVNTARLGGVSGKLFQLGSGGTADLNSDPTTAASIVDEAINQITSLRGRLGAFQRTSLETNKNALNDTLVNLTDAQSQIRDADFASETANLTRSQILVQSGTTVLGIANQNPQNVLALLRNA
jgi:flagellin